MAVELTPSDIRARKFRNSRRGYDRAEVTEFLGAVADRLGHLEAEMATSRQRLTQLGITKLPDLKAEMDDLGAEVQTVLDAAMSAAEGLRGRAHSDAAELMSEAQDVSTAARSDAWDAGTELLMQADATAEQMITEAKEDALFIRAEAEREAKRLVADAKRQADESARSARDDGERIIVLAKAESEAILEDARQAAEKAQERARALENRRSELLGELEAAESAIREIESPKTPPTPDPDVGIRVIASDSDDRIHWPENDGAVRILRPVDAAGNVLEEPEAIDAEEMAAEVAQMRSGVTLPQGSDDEAEPPVEELDIGSDGFDDSEVKVLPPQPDPEPEPDPELEPDPVGKSVPDPEPEAEPDPEPELEPDPVVESVPDPEPDAEPDPEPEPVPSATGIQPQDVPAPEIDDLFAKLRAPAQSDLVEEVAAPEVTAKEEPEPQPQDTRVAAGSEPTHAFDRRERVLLPIENVGLRGLKRSIVELQNRVLEELRTSDGQWRLGREFVVQMMGDDLDAVLTDSYRAGHAAAAESVGAKEPQVTGGPEQGAAEAFTVDLHADVQNVIEREAGVGNRQVSSDVRRVFRSWRTDEAERHVRHAARRAYNDGLLAGYSRIGVDAVGLAAQGRPCGECGAGADISWNPGGELPDGVQMPPAGPLCTAMIVAIGDNDINSRSEQ